MHLETLQLKANVDKQLKTPNNIKGRMSTRAKRKTAIFCHKHKTTETIF